MQPFAYYRPATADESLRLMATLTEGRSEIEGRPPAEFLAGGTTLVDLMKLGVMRPNKLVDLSSLAAVHGTISVTERGLRLGALATMAEVAAHPDIVKTYPVLAQSLLLAASAQLRNMATIGGNVLQRTRCTYFRDVSFANCNKRNPGSGCAAQEGVNRMQAVLGTSEACIATYPGDFAQSLMALDASVEILGRTGSRSIAFADLHRAPGATPHLETNLGPGEMITAFVIPAAGFTKRSLYLKIRDRQSYEFALASAAVALDLADGKTKAARIALGGVATMPWRAHEAEAALIDKPLDEAAARSAARIAFAAAVPRQHNGFKIELGQETLVRALLQAARMEA
jgi:xanthine dehydrogenase YagS FAD-binding subunit